MTLMLGSVDGEVTSSTGGLAGEEASRIRDQDDTNGEVGIVKCIGG